MKKAYEYPSLEIQNLEINNDLVSCSEEIQTFKLSNRFSANCNQQEDLIDLWR